MHQQLCKRCDATVPLLMPNGLCGICDITLYHKAPGMRQGYYDKEINPDIHEPAKERMLGIQLEVDAGRMTDADAARYKRSVVDPILPHENRLRHDGAYRAAWKQEADFHNEAQEEGERDRRLSLEKSRKALEDVSNTMKAEGYRPE